MSIKKILKLRDHWHYTAIGESHRESANIAQETAEALNVVLKSKKLVRELKSELANIRSSRA